MTLDALITDGRAWFAAALPDQGTYALMAFAFIAGLARGFSGFGAALIFIPLGGAIIGPKLVSPILLVVDGIATLGMIPPAWRNANRPEVFVMAAGAALGVPAGTAMLALLDPTLLRWSITIIAISLLALLVSGWRYHGAPSAPLSSGVGLIAGLFSGGAQLGGPPVVAYWLGGKSDFTRVRANVVLYFSSSTVFSAISYYVGGLFVPAVFALTAVVLPSYALGLYGGSKLFGLAKERTFRIACYVLIAAAAIIGMPLLDGSLH
ncbi:sulfite exporter TauE/SafE family protein [Rhizobium sp. MC63]|uniref:Sulfite exporter TauE/SafE family protein n=1 Tax=Rhizobium mulingense TaxID=3031128 RepID=A0ACC6N0E9_9HYPH|nr:MULTISPECIES: sulfite exporter TauE/SafE family protein [unclassified Rhizobium]MDF0699012.1 sulfite exporter TauE/SafE family protein [Rhizobium sp. MC63]MEA3519072.1 sulfite exporter TauE/SafE family protein [Rhizobium sp. MJ31]